MTIYELLYLGTLGIDVGLGVAVFFTNPRRRINQQYLAFSTVIAAWQLCGWYILHADTAERAEACIRAASVAAAFLPTFCWMLKLTIQHPYDTWGRLCGRAAPLLTLNALIAALCYTGFFLRSVSLAPAPAGQWSLAEPHYGPGFALYGVFFLGTGLALVGAFFFDLRALKGVQRVELSFIVLGAATGLILGTALGIVGPLLSGTSRYVPFSNSLSIAVLTAIIAYGIATRRIMGVADILRRCAAYALLTAYLSLLFFAVWRGSLWALRQIQPDLGETASYLIAALAVAFSMAPVSGVMQRFANRLFIRARAMNVPAAMQQAAQILQTVTTLDDLLERFADLVVRTTGAKHVAVLLWERAGFVQRFPPAADGPDRILAHDHPVVAALSAQTGPLVEYAIERRPSARLVEAARYMKAAEAPLVVGIYAKQELRGLVRIGPKMSGHLYDSTEQDTLQILCNQLAVSLDNARLYTELQDEKLYGEILLDSLVSGVIAVNQDRIITVFNHEASRITQLDTARVLNRPLEVLPPPLRPMLQTTLDQQKGLRDRDGAVRCPSGELLPVRLGTSLFHGHAGRVLGALLVVNDLSAIKRLEEQVRRTDRLASIGTLAAGMAHEIKNPLVTIKTFAQLLPQRFDDADFRENYAALVGEEVNRIDAIVNQLLHFTRPAKPILVPLRLHRVLDDSLRLVEQSARQKGIALERSFDAPSDRIQGDANQLTQAFVNFYLNAFDAMNGRPGRLSILTDEVPRWAEERDPRGEPVRAAFLRLRLRDSGRGIPAEALPRIFDPFFSTKDTGTGLGLSVAHGILQEHGCLIEVESEVDRGTTFLLMFPLMSAEVAS